MIAPHHITPAKNLKLLSDQGSNTITYVVCVGAMSTQLAVSTFGGAVKLDSYDRSFSAFRELQGLRMTPSANWPDAILCDRDLIDGEAFEFCQSLYISGLPKEIPFVVITPESSAPEVTRGISCGVDDQYPANIGGPTLHQRLIFLKTFKSRYLGQRKGIEFRMKPVKSPFRRWFDILLATFAIVLLSPLMLITAALIWLESDGPILYVSKRVGTGCKVFDFYKFRTMRQGAEQQLTALAGLNRYHGTGKGAQFVKLDKDPRVTPVGKILRSTSIDELPQLFNVLKGDMAIVGNRPLPLYEAEQLTTDQWALRFMAPAGITGLWQINRRHTESLSPEERIQMDLDYAQSHSLRGDLKILLGTLPAMWQEWRG
ncbi:MAG: sugar transferase [Bacteroidota bacterium]